jgi:hypothetical protein
MSGWTIGGRVHQKSSARKVTHLSTIQAFRQVNLGLSLLIRQGSLFLCCGDFALIRGVGVQEARTSGISI